MSRPPQSRARPAAQRCLLVLTGWIGLHRGDLPCPGRTRPRARGAGSRGGRERLRALRGAADAARLPHDDATWRRFHAFRAGQTWEPDWISALVAENATATALLRAGVASPCVRVSAPGSAARGRRAHAHALSQPAARSALGRAGADRTARRARRPHSSSPRSACRGPATSRGRQRRPVRHLHGECVPDAQPARPRARGARVARRARDARAASARCSSRAAGARRTGSACGRSEYARVRGRARRLDHARGLAVRRSCRTPIAGSRTAPRRAIASCTASSRRSRRSSAPTRSCAREGETALADGER
jgi:hypothetical protein